MRQLLAVHSFQCPFNPCLARGQPLTWAAVISRKYQNCSLYHSSTLVFDGTFLQGSLQSVSDDSYPCTWWVACCLLSCFSRSSPAPSASQQHDQPWHLLLICLQPLLISRSCYAGHRSTILSRGILWVGGTMLCMNCHTNCLRAAYSEGWRSSTYADATGGTLCSSNTYIIPRTH